MCVSMHVGRQVDARTYVGMCTRVYRCLGKCLLVAVYVCVRACVRACVCVCV